MQYINLKIICLYLLADCQRPQWSTNHQLLTGPVSYSYSLAQGVLTAFNWPICHCHFCARPRYPSDLSFLRLVTTEYFRTWYLAWSTWLTAFICVIYAQSIIQLISFFFSLYGIVNVVLYLFIVLWNYCTC